MEPGHSGHVAVVRAHNRVRAQIAARMRCPSTSTTSLKATCHAYGRIIDVDLKTGVSRSAWDACIAAQFPVVSYGSIVYEEAAVYTEDRQTDAVVPAMGGVTLRL